MNKVFVGLLSAAGILALSFYFGVGLAGGSRVGMLNSFDDIGYAEGRLEQILDAIQENDSDTIKKMFSKQAKEGAKNLDEEIMYLFNLIGSEQVSWESTGGNFHEENHHGKKVENYYYRFNVLSGDKQFLFMIEECTKDAYDTSNIGLTSIMAIDANEEEPTWDGLGIYVPDTEP